MNTARIYKDAQGNNCTIHQMVKNDPYWAASRIQVGEDAFAVLARIKEWDIEQYTQHGEFKLPQEIREAVQGVCAYSAPAKNGNKDASAPSELSNGEKQNG